MAAHPIPTRIEEEVQNEQIDALVVLHACAGAHGRPGGAGSCYATIQAAIDAAHHGDRVHVYPGTYHEGLTIKETWNFLCRN